MSLPFQAPPPVGRGRNRRTSGIGGGSSEVPRRRSARLAMSEPKPMNAAPTNEDGCGDMVLTIARAYGLLQNYEGREALEELALLEPHQRNMPSVLAMVGRAHFEMADYKAP